MKYSFRLLFILFFTLSLYTSYSQVNVKDSSINIPMIFGSAAFHVPGGDMAERFGVNYAAGAGFSYKTKGNWIFGVDFEYLFGTDVKIKDDLFRHLETSSGFIIDGNGVPADVAVLERGHFTAAKFGKLFPVFGPNPNSGIMFTAGAGYIRHIISISNIDNTAPQLAGDYRRGYDRLTHGYGLTQFIGYVHMSNKRTVNFFVGFEFIEAWTKSLRAYDFDLMQPDLKNRFDFLGGFKAGWILPLYGRAPQDYYFY